MLIDVIKARWASMNPDDRDCFAEEISEMLSEDYYPTKLVIENRRLMETLKRYENQFGNLEEASEYIKHGVDTSNFGYEELDYLTPSDSDIFGGF
jgi:hypothetical protein